MAAQVAFGRIPYLFIHSAGILIVGWAVFNRLCSVGIVTFALHVTELIFFCLEVSFADRLACFRIGICSDTQLAALQS